jgi:hypothetical protein
MVRRSRTAVAVLVLLGQLAAGASAAAVFWQVTGRDCECPHGETAAALCPMHKAPATGARCTLRSTHDTDVFALASLLGGAGIVPAAVSVTVPAAASVEASRPHTPSPSRHPVPDSPPPRG